MIPNGDLLRAGDDRRSLVRGPILVASIVRLAVIAAGYWTPTSPPWFINGDSPRYLALGESLAATGSFSYHGVPEIFRMPLFPAIVAVGSMLGNAIATTLVVHVALSCATVWMVCQLAASASDRRTGRIAGYLAATDPLLVAYTGLMLTETLFTFLVVLAVHLVVHARSSNALMAAGFAAGLCALVRPIGYLLPLALATAVILIERHQHVRLRARRALCVVVIAALPMAAWHLRNSLVAGYSGFSSQLDFAVFIALGATTISAEQQRDFWEVRGELAARVDDAGAGTQRNPAEAALASRRQGLQYLAGHSTAVVREHLRGMAQTLLQPPGADINELFRIRAADGPALTRELLLGRFAALESRWAAARAPDIVWMSMRSLYWATMLALILYGGSRLLRDRDRGRRMKSGPSQRVWAPTAMVIGYLLVVSGTAYGEARFRHPIMPFLCVPAAVAVNAIAHRWRT